VSLENRGTNTDMTSRSDNRIPKEFDPKAFSADLDLASKYSQ
jgi:hypothetical protein